MKIQLPNPKVVPFGKYKGQPIEVLAEDRQYLDWLMAQSWFREQYANHYTLIVNNFAEPSETPAHNAMQAEFLDAKFCLAFLGTQGEDLLADVCHDLDDHLDDVLRSAREYISKLFIDLGKVKKGGYSHELLWEGGRRRSEEEAIAYGEREINVLNVRIDELSPWCREDYSAVPTPSCEARFEVRGCDVVLHAWYQVKEVSWQTHRHFCIEIKPSLGDDYPAVLRQIGALKKSELKGQWVLLIGEYTGQGATLQQVRKIFSTAQITVLLRSEITA